MSSTTATKVGKIVSHNHGQSNGKPTGAGNENGRFTGVSRFKGLAAGCAGNEGADKIAEATALLRLNQSCYRIPILHSLR